MCAYGSAMYAATTEGSREIVAVGAPGFKLKRGAMVAKRRKSHFTTAGRFGSLKNGEDVITPRNGRLGVLKTASKTTNPPMLCPYKNRGEVG